MSAGTYTVASEPQRARDYPNKHGGNLTVWRLGLQDAQSQAPDGLFELHKKEGNDPPAVGDQLEVERTQPGEFNGEAFTRLFLAYKQDGAAPGGHRPRGGSSDPPDRFDRKPEHPRNESRMIHTSALSAAPGYINQAIAFGVLDAPKDEDAYWKLVGRVATKLARSYDHVLDARESPPAPAQEVPADTDGLSRPSISPDNQIGF